MEKLFDTGSFIEGERVPDVLLGSSCGRCRGGRIDLVGVPRGDLASTMNKPRSFDRRGFGSCGGGSQQRKEREKDEKGEGFHDGERSGPWWAGKCLMRGLIPVEPGPYSAESSLFSRAVNRGWT